MEFIPSDDADLSGIYQDHDLGGLALDNPATLAEKIKLRRARKKKARLTRKQARGQMYSRAGERTAQRQAARQQRKAARQAARQERRALRIEKKMRKGTELAPRPQGPSRRRRPHRHHGASPGPYPRPEFMTQALPPISREFKRRRRLKRIGGPGTRPPKSGLPAYLLPHGQVAPNLPRAAYQVEQSISMSPPEFHNIGVNHYGVAIANSRRLVRGGGARTPGKKARKRAMKRSSRSAQRPTPAQIAKRYEQCLETHGKDHPACQKLLKLHHMASRGKR